MQQWLPLITYISKNVYSVSRKTVWTRCFAICCCKRNSWELRTSLFTMLKISTRERAHVLISRWTNRCWSSTKPLIGKLWRSRINIWTLIKWRWIIHGFTRASCQLPLLSFFRFLEKKINPKICKGLQGGKVPFKSKFMTWKLNVKAIVLNVTTSRVQDSILKDYVIRLGDDMYEVSASINIEHVPCTDTTTGFHFGSNPLKINLITMPITGKKKAIMK